MYDIPTHQNSHVMERVQTKLLFDVPDMACSMAYGEHQAETGIDHMNQKLTFHLPHFHKSMRCLINAILKGIDNYNAIYGGALCGGCEMLQAKLDERFGDEISYRTTQSRQVLHNFGRFDEALYLGTRSVFKKGYPRLPSRA